MGIVWWCEIKQHGPHKTSYCRKCSSKLHHIGHRSLLKLMFNPFLRKLGFEIYSEVDEYLKFRRYGIHKISAQNKVS